MNGRFHVACLAGLLALSAVSCLCAAPATTTTSAPATQRAPAPPPPVPPAQVELLIRQCIHNLYARQKGGHWEAISAGGPGQDQGGVTALCLYALLAAGESPQNPKLKDAIELVRKAKMSGTYAIAMRLNAFSYLPPASVNREMKADFEALMRGLIDMRHPAGGLYGYVIEKPDPARIDHSVSQYGVLGVWAAAQAGFDPGDAYWRRVEMAWLRDQRPDGGWSYEQRPDSRCTGSMTAAGVATLFITQDYLRARDGLACKGNIRNDAIEHGLAWIAANFRTDINPKADDRWKYYWLYGLERIGVASGRKYLGGHNWFDEGARALLADRDPKGGFKDPSLQENVISTSFALLFLARGYRPILMSKLQYDGPWNQRPRDVANVTRWVSRRFEAEAHWLSVDIDTDVQEFHDSPILYIAGSDALKFTADQKAKLKQFVENGGLILGHADCHSRSFIQSFTKMMEEMFPFLLRQLPDDHLIYRQAPLKKPLPLWGQSNGLRELCVLIADGDPARAWQGTRPEADIPSFEFAQNIFLYVTDKGQLRKKGDLLVPVADPAVKTTRRVRVARIEHAGRYDPEPGGWRRMAALLHNQNHIEVAYEKVKLGQGKLPGMELAHLSGMEAITLTEDQTKELRAFIARGGTLLIDAAGGAPAFADSIATQLGGLITGAKLESIVPGDPLFAPPTAEDQELYVEYRRAARARLTLSHELRLKGLRLGRRWAVIFSTEDLTHGLTGRDVDGIAGYTPVCATEIVRRIVVNGTRR